MKNINLMKAGKINLVQLSTKIQVFKFKPMKNKFSQKTQKNNIVQIINRIYNLDIEEIANSRKKISSHRKKWLKVKIKFE